jgi:thiol-disulfide isomerase/thioredoxin
VLRSALTIGLAARCAAGLGLDGAESPRSSPTPVADRIRGREIAGQLAPLDHPEHRTVASATHMRDDDLVWGVVVAGRARAYPWWILKNYHVVNDVVADVPVAIAFCEQCSAAAAYRRTSRGRVLSMEVPGVYNGTIILRDRETRTLWAPFSGRAIEGPLAGERLDRFPFFLTHWDEWVARHADTDVLWARPSAREGHGAWYTPGKWGIVSQMGATLAGLDPRLPENALVYGVEAGPGAKAYPLAEVERHGGVVNDVAGPIAVLVVVKGAFEAAGYERHLRGRLLTFRPSTLPGTAMTDAETGSTWSSEGEALGGPLRGERLAALDGYPVEWHVWSAYHPGADLFGRPGAAAPRGNRGERAFPELTLATLPSGTQRRITWAGKVNLVVLWAAWCSPCRLEMPLIQDLVRERSSQGLAAVGIAVHIPEEIERDAVLRFVAETGILFPVFQVDDPSYERLDQLARDLGGPGLVLPMVFVVDERGKVLDVLSGKGVDALRKTVATLLDGAADR